MNELMTNDFGSPLLGFLKVWFMSIQNNFTNVRKHRGTSAGRAHIGSAIGDARDGLLVFVFFAIMIVVVLVLSGPSTGSTGIFGNALVATQWRNAGLTLSQFAVVVGLLIIIVIIGALA